MTTQTLISLSIRMFIPSLLFSFYSVLGHHRATKPLPVDTLAININTETKLKIQRKVTQREQYVQGNAITEQRTITIKVQNILSKKTTVRVEELLPDVHQPNIELELMQHSNATFDIEHNRLVWNLTLKPKQIINLAVKYKVLYQKGTPKIYL